MSLPDLSSYDFAKVMPYPENPDDRFVFDFTDGYDPEFIRQKEWGIGKYNEKRANMYVAPQYNNERNIHMGIDIWAKAGEPVFSFYEGTVAYKQDNNQQGNYGPTIVLRYKIDGTVLYALYGHLSRASLQMLSFGEIVRKGQRIGELGQEEVNGGWIPHLHFQLSLEDPGEADMPGVVSADDREQALQTYPDPRIVLRNLY
jgi:murein DD-endopeptidase MepM/ murein hydrolase activator NlpD